MKLKVLLILMLAAVTFTSYAQDGGIRGKVVSRNGRVALSNVQVKIESLGLTAMTDKDGNFIFENLPAGSYTVLFSTPDFEDLNLMVRVGDKHVQDLKSVIIVPSGSLSNMTPSSLSHLMAPGASLTSLYKSSGLFAKCPPPSASR